jgi:hypothetical protein
MFAGLGWLLFESWRCEDWLVWQLIGLRRLPHKRWMA